MADFAVYCVPAVDLVAVAPCGTYQSVAMTPEVRQVSGDGPLDYSNTGQYFAYSLSVVVIVYLVGHVVGTIIGLIREA